MAFVQEPSLRSRLPSSRTAGHGDSSPIAQIEGILCSICTSLLQEDTLSIPLRTKTHHRSSPSISPSSLNNQPQTPIDRLAASPTAPPNGHPIKTSYYQTTFPAPPQNTSQVQRFTILLRILDCVHAALSTNAIISKRNIYYQDPLLFKSQAVVDRYIDILAYTFGCTRRDLNVTAAAGKGLVHGDIIVRYTKDNDDDNNDNNGSGGGVRSERRDGIWGIEDVHQITSIFAPNADFILIVEKESTFRTLTSSSRSNSDSTSTSSSPNAFPLIPTKGIILTAKGYPDLSTRYFLNHLTRSTPHLPIFTLTDYDPDGFAIESIYAFGSQTLAHEQRALRSLCVKRLGVRWRDIRDGILKIGVPAGGGGADGAIADGDKGKRVEDVEGFDDSGGLMRLSARDRKKGISVLKRQANEGDMRGKEEVQRMLMLGYKAEMEIFGAGVRAWVERRLREEMGIPR